MASPVVTNSDTALNGKTLLLAETSATVTGGLIPASDAVQIGWVLRKITTLTAAQVKALFTTPITLVGTPGSGKIILVTGIVFASTFVSVAYAGANALEFRYTGAAGAKVTADIAAAVLNFTSGTQYNAVAGVTAALVPVANAPIVVAVPTANPTAGDSPVKITVTYLVLTTP